MQGGQRQHQRRVRSLYYVRSTQRGSLDHVDRIGWYERQNCLVLDAVTVRNLELIEPLFAGTDAGVTCSGRSMRNHADGKAALAGVAAASVVRSRRDQRRLDAVEAGVKDIVAREELRRALDGVLDLERLLEPGHAGDSESPRCLGSGGFACEDSGHQSFGGSVGPRDCRLLHGLLDELDDLRGRIDQTIVAEPPLTFSDGGVIAPGIDRDLDELRELSRNSKAVLAQIEQRERTRTGISSLKVKFNSVFGYYIEISKSNLHLVPQDYERKQTLVGAERFTTPELKEYEAKILDAQEKIVDIERRIFTELRTAIAAEANVSGKPPWRWLKWMSGIDGTHCGATELLPSPIRRKERANWKLSKAGIL